MRIELGYINKDNPLEKEVYVFWVKDSQAGDSLLLILGSYKKQSKPSKQRRNWNNEVCYERLYPTYSTCKKGDVPLPENVKEDAIRALIERIAVTI